MAIKFEITGNLTVSKIKTVSAVFSAAVLFFIFLFLFYFFSLA
jgi:hypothetical protein